LIVSCATTNEAAPALLVLQSWDHGPRPPCLPLTLKTLSSVLNVDGAGPGLHVLRFQSCEVIPETACRPMPIRWTNSNCVMCARCRSSLKRAEISALSSGLIASLRYPERCPKYRLRPTSATNLISPDFFAIRHFFQRFFFGCEHKSRARFPRESATEEAALETVFTAIVARGAERLRSVAFLEMQELFRRSKKRRSKTQIKKSCRATLIMSPCGDIRNVPMRRSYDNRNVP
jgi:hypothetical protein